MSDPASIADSFSPDRYQQFRRERERAGADLMAELPELDGATAVVDLGCGTGSFTAQLADFFPGAAVTGVDASPAMLAKAEAISDQVSWMQMDIGEWQAPVLMDLIWSNAALHWLPDHETLFTRLAESLKAGGVLAVQMPRNHAAPSHSILRQICQKGPWAERLADDLAEEPVQKPMFYYDLLAPYCDSVDVWETTYLHVLTGEDAVLDWMSGTTMAPILTKLDEDEREKFLSVMQRELAKAYPIREDGTTLLPFKRLFIMATRTANAPIEVEEDEGGQEE
ncbi:MAG: methyltransferase domain-containing protein [Alphaproteobacteria bacterium]